MLSSGSAAIGVSALAGTNSYGNDRNDVVEYANESGFFHADYKKHDDLKQMLDSNKDNLKLEAMKRIIGMIAKGRDASELFPAVVKNVVSKNIEVKKLVYVYLVRYAEEQQDLALLSISTFQRALKDPNQLIRASALRVLSSIRVSMIVPIVMLAIRDSASDMSPYVRKTAAHAIPKLYSLDPEQKDELITVIEKLLADRTTLVVGSAVMAFEEVCPERTDLIHKNYRKLCNLLVDVDEWGQVLIINMLTRYARTQFSDPNVDDFNGEDELENKSFYDEYSSESDQAKSSPKSPRKTYSLDIDHRLLLRQAKPLLQSRNASVVMSVAQLYHHIAPKNEVGIVAKALIRLLRSHKEVQSVVLTCIASMSVRRKVIFEQYLKSFFVRSSDQTHIKLLKLDILTNLATETSISIILREFQTYISSNDKDFVASTIQAIGRCAASIKEVADTCLSGLVHLLSNKDEYVVAESVVVIKNLLQTQKEEHFDIITLMAKLLDFIQVPAARASILWLIGEYNDKVPKIAPDVLRKLAKSFIDEEDVVKLQILNLAVKLYLKNSQQTELLCQYVINLARYDQNYDIRDRARYLKQFIFPEGKQTTLARNARNIFLAEKPAPTLESKYYDRNSFQLGSLSHYLNMRVAGYQDLPSFPEIVPDSSVRNVEPPPEYVQSIHSFDVRKVDETVNTERTKEKRNHKARSFYSDSEKSSSDDDSSSESSDSSSESSGSASASNRGSESDENDISKTSYNEVDGATKSKEDFEMLSSGTEDESNDSSSDTGSYDSTSSADGSKKSDDSSDSGSAKIESKYAKSNRTALKISNDSSKKSQISNLDLLLDLDDILPAGPVMTPSLGGLLSPISGVKSINPISSYEVDLVGPSFVSTQCSELLNKVNGFGLGITYRFTRAPNLHSERMISIELNFTNHGNTQLADIQLGKKNLQAEMSLSDFPQMDIIHPKQSWTGVLGIDFNDSTQPATFEIKSSGGINNVTLKAPLGELIRSVSVSEDFFMKERAKLRGMTEHLSKFKMNTELSIDKRAMCQRIYEVANVANIPSSGKDCLLFAGQTLCYKNLVLITLLVDEHAESTLTINCEKIVVGSMLLNEIKAAIKN
ncbi:AP-3 complex subunit beta-2 [Toxorhynchites rutilus septentrionalis]|uniref:AP-3 complex subunit beta-2 n=1 Tax=Toxorhynchites rutilus septentrionalis TaxID=329112 RepID=UPI00247A43DE|nr:AP-3 complex subunit beta-2 [Toxorhynchites rutilus septentrionalis]